MKVIWVGVGVVMVLLGGVWMLQGWGVIGGSGMSGSTKWAIIGVVVAVIGLALAVFGLTRKAGARPR